MSLIARLASLASLLLALTSGTASAADAPVSLVAEIEAFLTATAAPLLPAGQGDWLRRELSPRAGS